MMRRQAPTTTSASSAPSVSTQTTTPPSSQTTGPSSAPSIPASSNVVTTSSTTLNTSGATEQQTIPPVTASSPTPGISGGNGTYTLFPDQIGNGVNVSGLTGLLTVQPVRSNWIAPGLATGIAIATLLIGAAVAIVIMLITGRNKKRKNRSSRLQNYTSGNGHSAAQSVPRADDKVAEHGAVPPNSNEKVVMSSNTTDSDFLLPQPKDDQSMGSTANQLFVHIGNHVENFYHNDSMREAISPRSEDEELLVNRKTRFFALKRQICREVLEAIALDCNPDYSLLSASVVSMTQSMSRGNMDENIYAVAWSRWKVSTALLLKAEDPSQKTQAREYWLDRLQHQLRPFQMDNPGVVASAQEDLHAICKLAENLASLIFSQPATWEFGWPRSESRGRFVIVPEFVRTTDSKGRRLDRPKRVLEAQWMQ